MDKFVFYALAYLMPVIAFHSHWMRLFFAHILAAVWIHPATLFNPDHLLNDSEQYEFLSKIQGPGDMSWYSLNDVSERLAESLSYDAITQLDIHTIFYIFYPPSVVLAFWACVFFMQDLNSDEKES